MDQNNPENIPNKKIKDTAPVDIIGIFIKFDIVVFIASLLRKRNILLLIIPILLFSGAAYLGKKYSKTTWTTYCVLIRHKIDQALQKELPSLFVPVNLSTISKSVTSKNNLEKVIEKLNLKMKPEDLSGNIEVDQPKKTDTLIIEVTASSSQLSAEIANELAEVFIVSYSEQVVKSSEQVLGSYKKNRDTLVGKVVKLEAGLKDLLKSNNVVYIEDEASKRFELLNEMKLRLLEIEMKRSDLLTKINAINGSVTPHVATESESSSTSKTPNAITLSIAQMSEINDIRKTLQELLLKYTKENPKVMMLESKINFLTNYYEELNKSQTNDEDGVVKPPQLSAGMRIALFEAETELKSLDVNAVGIAKRIVEFEENLSDIVKVKSIYDKMKSKIVINKELLNKLDIIIGTTEIALKANVKDIEILNRALPPRFPNGTMTKILAVAGGFLGFVIALLIMVLPELLNITVKSGAELKNIFRIKSLGQIPDQDKITTSIFFGAVNIMFNSFIKVMEGITSPSIVFCSGADGVGKSFIIKSIADILITKDKKVLCIESIEEYETKEDIKNFIINDFLYKKNMNYKDIQCNAIEENLDKVYFNLNEDTYISILEKEKIINLIDYFKKDYDYIFIELFEFLKNQQLFATFTVAADQTFVVTEFKRTGKLQLKTMLDFIRAQNCLKIVGVVNNIKKYYYKFIT
jgi:capsular polysaccharide biosynthesis protein